MYYKSFIVSENVSGRRFYTPSIRKIITKSINNFQLILIEKYLVCYIIYSYLSDIFLAFNFFCTESLLYVASKSKILVQIVRANPKMACSLQTLLMGGVKINILFYSDRILIRCIIIDTPS